MKKKSFFVLFFCIVFNVFGQNKEFSSAEFDDFKRCKKNLFFNFYPTIILPFHRFKKFKISIFSFLIFLGFVSCKNLSEKKTSDLNTAINLFYQENKNDSVLLYLNKNLIKKSTNENKILSEIIRAAAVCESDKVIEADEILQNIQIKDKDKDKDILCWYNSIKGLILFRKNQYSESYKILFKTLSNKEIDIRTLALNERIIARIFLSIDDDKNTLEYFLLSNKHFKKANLIKSVAINYKFLGRYSLKNDNYQYALNYFNQSEKILKKSKDIEELFYVYINYLDFYINTKKYNQALHYAKICEKIANKLDDSNMKSLVNNNFAEIAMEQRDYKRAIHFLNSTILLPKGYKSEYIRKINAYLKLSITYDSLRELKKTEYYAVQAENYCKHFNDNDLKYEIFKHLNNYYQKTHQYQKSRLYLDSINLYLKNKLETANITSNAFHNTKLELINAQIINEKEKTNRNIAFSGIGFLLLLSGGGFWFFKNKQKQKELQSQNTLLSLQQNLNAMELQSLNQQLDPHEIKNLLGSISPEIQEKAPESYKKMLKLFNITKASLNNSSITDTVENQIQQIEDLLSLEKSTLHEPLEYSIDNKIENQQMQIPRLMLKNLVENAVKHGIKGKENGGEINVALAEVGNFIEITVDDTGKGRQKAISLDSGIGTSTYQKLFSTLNQKNTESASFEIKDKEQGTKVVVKIPKDYKYS